MKKLIVCILALFLVVSCSEEEPAVVIEEEAPAEEVTE